VACNRVLLVEPDPGIRSALKEGLEDEGLQFCSAPDARSARELLEQDCVPAVVVLDYPYPSDESGRVLELLHSDPRLKDVRVLVTTTLPRHMLPVDADVVLRKPFDLEEFLLAVRSLAKGERVEPGPGEPAQAHGRAQPR
jgi:DNA-binding response OmpR family regulator